MNKALFLTSMKLKITITLILNKIYSELKVPIEYKRVRVQNRIHFVSTPITKKRKTFLIVKWVFEAIKMSEEKKKKIIFKIA